MSDERWTRVKDLWSYVLGLPADLRHQKLQEACPDDASLIYEVENLVNHHQPPDDIRDAVAGGIRRLA